MMREKNSWPPCFDYNGKEAVTQTLELYFEICSILSTNKCMSIMASTLANGGLNPISGLRLVDPEHVRCALPLMLTCGMYDYSGQWAFDVGIPAKSGVGGCVFMVVPNVMGISVWSPRLDSVGNSVRGVATAKAMTERLQVHNFEVFSGLSRKKIDPTARTYWAMDTEISRLLEAASSGNLVALMPMASAGTNMYVADYDKRTAVHVAAMNGHATVLEFLISNAPEDERADIINAKDRWDSTPLDGAVFKNNQ
jgi:glutaminase